MVEVLKKEDLLLYKNLIDKCFGKSNDLSFYKRYSENENYIIFVIKKHNLIIGSVTIYKLELFTFSFQPVLELFNICVLEEYQNQKIGKKLVEEVIKYAKENGYKSMNLTCLETATMAHKLYESVGMKKMSSIKYSMNF